jgi:hypothetical protein
LSLFLPFEEAIKSGKANTLLERACIVDVVEKVEERSLPYELFANDVA